MRDVSASAATSPGTSANDRQSGGGLLVALGLVVVVVGLMIVPGALAASASIVSTNHSKAPPHHPSKHKNPCLVGNWTATNFTLNESGETASGGAGTQVDIAANKAVLGHFTPGAPLTSTSGSFKFSGTDVGTYQFSSKTTAKSGTFPVTYSSASTLMLSVNGSAPKPVPAGPTTGSYVCAGKGLTLAFPSGGNQITYTLVPSK